MFIGVQLTYNLVLTFCCVAKWISHSYTYIHFFLDSFSTPVIAEYWEDFPVLYSRSLLVIYFIYSSVYVTIPVSQFIPPFFPPNPITINLFSTFVTTSVL